MIFPKAKKIAIELDWHTTKNGVFGLYKDYFFTVSDANLLSNPQCKYVVATTDDLTEEQRTQIKAALDANKKSLKFSNYEVGERHISVQFIETWVYTKIHTVYSLFDFFVDLFKKIGIPAQNKCYDCGTKENLNYYNLNNGGALLCDACFRKIEDEHLAMKSQKHFADKNYLTGFLGSIAFSVAGIIAWVLVAVYLERLAAAMAMVIGYLGIKGYQYFKGQQGKWTKYIVVLSNIICILIANAATTIALLIKDAGFTLNESFIAFRIDFVRDLFYSNTAISFILAFFVWIWLFVSLKEEKMTINRASKVKR